MISLLLVGLRLELYFYKYDFKCTFFEKISGPTQFRFAKKAKN